MTNAAIKTGALVVLALAGATLCAVAAWHVDRLGRQANLALIEATQTAKQTKIAAFEVQAAAKAARAEWESPESLRARRSALRLGEAGQVTLARLNDDLLPELVQTTAQARQLLANSDRRINQELLPQITSASRNLSDLAAAFQADEQQIAAALVSGIRAGTASAEQVQKILSSEAIPSILANLDASSEGMAKTSANVAAMTDQWPEMATEINKILKTGRQWQRPVMIASLLLQLARVL